VAWLEAIAGGVGAFATGIGSIFGFEAVEEPRYEVLRQEGTLELRRYAPYALAEITLEGDFRATQREGFQRLARYIFGGNQARRDLPMTAPVTLEPESPMADSEALPMTAPVTRSPAGNGWTTAFVLPAGVTASNAPVPTDTAVRVRDVPARDVAAIRFSGSFSEAEFRRQEQLLRAWLSPEHVAAGPARWAGYNPPFTLPFLRRNEVLLPLVPSESKAP
jgi:hypothetical protein